MVEEVEAVTAGRTTRTGRGVLAGHRRATIVEFVSRGTGRTRPVGLKVWYVGVRGWGLGVRVSLDAVFVILHDKVVGLGLSVSVAAEQAAAQAAEAEAAAAAVVEAEVKDPEVVRLEGEVEALKAQLQQKEDFASALGVSGFSGLGLRD